MAPHFFRILALNITLGCLAMQLAECRHCCRSKCECEHKHKCEEKETETTTGNTGTTEAPCSATCPGASDYQCVCGSGNNTYLVPTTEFGSCPTGQNCQPNVLEYKKCRCLDPVTGPCVCEVTTAERYQTKPSGTTTTTLTPPPVVPLPQLCNPPAKVDGFPLVQVISGMYNNGLDYYGNGMAGTCRCRQDTTGSPLSDPIPNLAYVIAQKTPYLNDSRHITITCLAGQGISQFCACADDGTCYTPTYGDTPLYLELRSYCDPDCRAYLLPFSGSLQSQANLSVFYQEEKAQLGANSPHLKGITAISCTSACGPVTIPCN